MNRKMTGACLGLLTMISASAQTTLDQCQRDAADNYPLIRKYDLVSKSADLTVANIGKEWLPQISASAQATLQNKVAALPDELGNVLTQMGRTAKGLKKDQYRIGVDISQTVFDGDRIRDRKEIARLQGTMERAQNDVDLYQVRQRINELYFGALLIDERLMLNSDLQQLLAANEKKLAAMVKNGVASDGDLYSVQAERLSAVQQATELKARKASLLRMLTAFCGHETDSLTRPVMPAVDPQQPNGRPELRLIDSRIRLADAQEKMLDANLRPRLSLFAQGYYGYPGYDMFRDMMDRSFSLNGMIGAKLTWNIGALYTRRNDKAKLRLQRDQAENQRDVFLFNNNLDQIRQKEDISRYRQLMSEDEKIMALRSKVRLAAESRLTHGIIDVNDLIKEINSENSAKIQYATHEIEMLKQMYDYKYTVNQ